MKIYCSDGTTVDCAAFRALDSGILLFDEEPEGDEAHDEATGFVPITQLQYVLPDDARPGPQQAPQRARRSPPGAGIGGPPGGAGGQQGGGIGLQQGPSGGGRSQSGRGGGSGRESPGTGHQR